MLGIFPNISTFDKRRNDRRGWLLSAQYVLVLAQKCAILCKGSRRLLSRCNRATGRSMLPNDLFLYCQKLSRKYPGTTCLPHQRRTTSYRQFSRNILSECCILVYVLAMQPRSPWPCNIHGVYALNVVIFRMPPSRSDTSEERRISAFMSIRVQPRSHSDRAQTPRMVGVLIRLFSSYAYTICTQHTQNTYPTSRLTRCH